MDTSMSPDASLEGHPVTGEAKVDAGMNLFVANLSADVTDDTFGEMFGQHGRILSAKVMLDIHTGISRGFGFVLYASEAEGLNALAELQGKSIGKKDNPMVITRAQTTGRNAVSDTPKLHLRNVPRVVTETDLNALLSKYGQTERVIMKEDTDTPPQVTSVGGNGNPPKPAPGQGVPMWRVFVQYTTSNDAKAAVAALHNSKPWPDMVVPLMAKPAETPEMRQARKQRQDGRKPGVPGDKRGQTGSSSPGHMSVQVGPGQHVPMQQQQQIMIPPGNRPVQVLPPGLAPPGMMVQPGLPPQQFAQAAPGQQVVLVQPGGMQPQQRMQQPQQQQQPPGYSQGGMVMQFQPQQLQVPQGGGMHSMSDSMEFSLTNSFGGSWNWGHMPPGAQPNLMLVNSQPVQTVQPPVGAHLVMPPHLQQQTPGQQQPPQYVVQQQPPPIQQSAESLVPVFPGGPPQHFVQSPSQPQFTQQPQSKSPSTANNDSAQPHSPLVPPLDQFPSGSPKTTANLEASLEELSRSGGLAMSPLASLASSPRQQPQPAGGPQGGMQPSILIPGSPPHQAQFTAAQQVAVPQQQGGGQQQQYVMVMPQQQM